MEQYICEMFPLIQSIAFRYDQNSEHIYICQRVLFGGYKLDFFFFLYIYIYIFFKKKQTSHNNKPLQKYWSYICLAKKQSQLKKLSHQQWDPTYSLFQRIISSATIFEIVVYIENESFCVFVNKTSSTINLNGVNIIKFWK